ncbi:unnamed protein product [Dicrocoelium dendriticum]|nr:unnamed protein product [Dicrocoelium dendriticum]
MEQMRERLKILSTEKISVDRALDQLKLQLSGLQTRSAQQDADLLTQRELITELETQLTERVAELEKLQPRVAELDACKQRVHHLEDEVKHWRTLSQEQETSLSEMAAVVSSSKLEADSLRESHNALTDAQWADDSVVPNCLQCNAAFSVSRRRHHCRNCGLIFCHNCSSNAMSLPSSAKPVRVCDKCHALLLLRYAAKS